MSITCGIDWAEAHHDVALIDEHGVAVARSRIDTGAAGFSALLALIAEHGGGVDDTPVAVETDKNLIVVALVEAGFTVYPINPRGVARYRERYGQAGAKSDPGDATVLAHVLRTDRHMHRRLPANTSQASAIKVLARQHQEAIWALHQTVSRLRSVLLEFYPQALQAFPNLQHHAATTVLAAVPTPAAAGKLTRTRVATLLRRSGRGNQAALAERILTELRVPSLRQPSCVEEAYGHTVQGLVGAVEAMRTAADALEKALACEFDQHPSRICCGLFLGWDQSWQLAFWQKSVMTPHVSTIPKACAHTRAPRRSPSPPGVRATSRPARCATSASPMPATGGPSPP